MTMNKKLNILMVAACPFPANHGSAASIREMSEALVQFGHTVHVVTYPIQEDIPVKGVIIHRVNPPFVKPGAVKVGPTGNKFVYDPMMIVKTLQIIKQHKIDVIHAHNYEGALIGWFGKILGRKPMLYNAVNSMADELPTYNFIKPNWLAVWLGKVLDYFIPRTGNYVTVVSDALKEFLNVQGLKDDMIKVVPAGVNLDMFAQGDGEKIRKRHNLYNIPVVMYTGALEQFQRIDYLLQAFKETLVTYPAAQLLLVGNIVNVAGRIKYTEMAKQLGIADHVLFLDSIPLHELADHLAIADVTVIPRPDCPGHPVKLLNYMAANKAIVSFKGGAKGLHHMHNGYLVNDHDYQALGQGISFLLGNPEISNTLGYNAKKTIEGNFDWETLARGIEAIYYAMLNGFTAEANEKIDNYIKNTYVFSYIDRRDNMNTSMQNMRSNSERRAQETSIDFIERRKIGFSTKKPALPQASHNHETTMAPSATTSVNKAITQTP